VGRKDRGKGLPELVAGYEDFARRLGADAPPLVLLGEGDDALVPHGDAFMDLGFGSEAQKLALQEGALATINLSTHESFSLVVMESWLSHTPVIVSADCGVTAGHCARSGGGIAVSGSAELGAALGALRDRALGALAGKAGHAYVETEYAWDAVTDRFARAVWGAPCES
jgi:glycosyltransferase involved in cell wall biosynthesis